jgi:hypothetical protein
MKPILGIATLALALISGLGQAQTSVTFTFDIPAGSLQASIQRFAGTIGGDAVFDHTATSAQTRPVRGQMSPESALNEMLSGTGLSYRYNAAARRVVVSRRR